MQALIMWKTIAFILITAFAAPAQVIVSAKAGFVQMGKGEVFLDGTPLQFPLANFVQMKNGQSISTKQGFAEVSLKQDSYIRLGEESLLRMDNNRLDRVELSLEQGSALLEVVEDIKMYSITVCLHEHRIKIKAAGLYRLSVDDNELRVYGGSAVVENGNRIDRISKGKMINLDNNARSKFDMNFADKLHQWAAQRSFDLYTSYSLNSNQTHWRLNFKKWNNETMLPFINDNYRISFSTNVPWVFDMVMQAFEKNTREREAQQKAAIEEKEKIRLNNSVIDNPQAPTSPVPVQPPTGN
jgi:hypothetical protein